MKTMTTNDLLSGWIRAPRWLALRLVAIIVMAATVAAFTESYRGLYDWAARHGMSGFWAAAWPLQVDTFIIVGELMLFVAVTDRWPRRRLVAAWVATIAGVAVSVAGNIGHAPTHDVATRLTFAIPPLSAAAALFLGLVILKAVMSGQPEASTAATVTAREVAMARSGECAYGAGLSASDRAREAGRKRAEADKRRQEKADKERTPKQSRRPVSVRPGRRSVSTKQDAIKALIEQPDMSAEDLAGQYGVTGRTGRRWREEARELAASAAANGNGAHPA